MNRATDYDRVSQCTRCPALGKEHVPAEGSSSAEVFIIGQSPGVQEVEAQRPFVGPSGEILDYMLDEAGLTREDVYITNTLKCHPPGNRAGHPEELEECWNMWLKRELLYVRPKIIVLVGKDAWKAVTKGKIEFKHGAVSRTSKGNTFLVLYHPAYFLRSGDIEEFVLAGQKLKELLNGPASSEVVKSAER